MAIYGENSLHCGLRYELFSELPEGDYTDAKRLALEAISKIESFVEKLEQRMFPMSYNIEFFRAAKLIL